MPEKTPEEILVDLKRKRASCKARLTNFKKHLASLDLTKITDLDVIELQNRLEKLPDVLSEFEQYQNHIESIVKEEELQEQYDSRGAFETDFYSILATATKICSDNKHLDINDRESVHSGRTGYSAKHSSKHSEHFHSPENSAEIDSIKLPTIKLPQFDGQYSQWLSFYDTFNSIIHKSKKLTDIQRFYYLRSSLQGEAEQVIRSLEVSEANYQAAWSLLQKRYENKNLMIHTHIKGIMEIPKIPKESFSQLRQLVDTTQNHIRALQALKQPIESWDSLLIYILADKLDFNTKKEWESQCVSDSSIPTMEVFTEFLERRCNLLEKLDKPSTSSTYQSKLSYSKDKFQAKLSLAATQNQTSRPVCVICQGQHYIYACKSFLDKSATERQALVKQHKLCLNCLRSGHSFSTCRSAYHCPKCPSRHNTLLHVESAPQASQESSQAQNQNVAVSNHSSQNLSAQSHKVLATAIIHILDSHGQKHDCLALLDPGSQVNFITTNLCTRLRLKTTAVNLPTFGIGISQTGVVKRTIATISSKHHDHTSTLSFCLMPRITLDLPCAPLDLTSLNIPKEISLANPQFMKPAPVDLLIGVELFWELLLPDKFNIPYLHNSYYGYLISGNVPQQSSGAKQLCHLSTIDISKQLEKFWEIENCPDIPNFSSEELECEKHFKNHVQRNSEGRFIVSLPLKLPAEHLGESKSNAEAQLKSLEKRFNTNPTLKKNYIQFMESYEQAGYMTPVAQDCKSITSTFYMPHHGILKEESITTKFRIVFNGSYPSSTGISVNDIQMVGPVLQSDLFTILLRFRTYKYAISADIAKMYNQVLIDPNDRSLQRIVWRSDPYRPIQTYELNTVTYGTAAASFLAIRCLLELANEHKLSHPEISSIIQDSMYVDDLLTGANTVAQATQICKEISQILKTGCFELRKWVSNEPSVLEGIKDANIDHSIVELSSNGYAKTLGLSWSCSSDQLVYQISVKEHKYITKRSVLSIIASLYDPLGLVGPCTIVAKIMLQTIWKLNLGWDDELPEELQLKWSKYRRELPLLNGLRIPRYILSHPMQALQIISFSDASEAAYGGCVYLRSVSETGEVAVRLLCAKSKVAPLKSLTLPRLELLGALTAAKLTHKIIVALNLQETPCLYWCDSTIVIGWIHSHPHELKTFIRNRVSQIHAISSPKQWNHISGKDNPADFISRGLGPTQLKDSPLWWEGPSFLKEPESEWPYSNRSAEVLPEYEVTHAVTQNFSCPYFEKYSDLSKLERVTAWCIRFTTNCKSKARQQGPLTSQEIDSALITLIKCAQEKCFSEEIQLLAKGRSISKRSKLLSLKPFIHSDGTLRVGGRLDNSNFSFSKKHPIILHSSHVLTKLICTREHIRLLHAGPSQLLYSLRQIFWPLSGRNLVRKIVHSCIRCFKVNPKATEALMGDLPKQRVTPSAPFSCVGLDYAGPFTVKDRKGRGVKLSKAYVCLFICLSTKALHIELVSDLSKDAFILALRRFSARRGMPSYFYSDNGTNFVAAHSELKAFGNFLKDNEAELSNFLSKHNFTWKFIPAYSPHMGGIYEAGVKSLKFHLKRVLANSILTFEELYSVLAQIESILNSRPLTPLSSHPSDLQPLTPGHFLIGRPLTMPPDPDVTFAPENRLNRYQLLQQLQQHFWARWSKEYISELQCRTKWKSNTDPIKIGTLVVLKEDRLPPLKWKLGRIVSLHPGNDGITRVVTVKTSKGEVRRALNRLCPLPVEK